MANLAQVATQFATYYYEKFSVKRGELQSLYVSVSSFIPSQIETDIDLDFPAGFLDAYI
jgi:hypothetical protein